MSRVWLSDRIYPIHSIPSACVKRDVQYEHNGHVLVVNSGPLDVPLPDDGPGSRALEFYVRLSQCKGHAIMQAGRGLKAGTVLPRLPQRRG